MISLASIEQAVAGSLTPAQLAAAESDERVSRVLDCAEFYRWRENCDGSRTAFFILRKTIVGAPAGKVLSLAELHDLLFPPKDGRRP
jgi:hypothetical protein